MKRFRLQRKESGVLLLTVVFITGLFTGCGQRTGTTGAAVTGSTQTSASGVVTYPVSGQPKVTISRLADTDIHTAGFSSYNDTPGVKALIKQTGINVEFVELVDNNAYMLYLAGGNLPDIIMCNKTFYPGGGFKMHEDGLARDLTDLLPQYAPDYWKFINSNEQYYKAIREPDGKHYSFAGYFREPGSIYSSWIGLVARKEFLDKLGMAAPETVDELYQYLSRSKAELGVDIPFMSARNRFPTIFTGGSLTSPFGLPRADAYHVNGKVHYGAYDPQYKEVMRFFNKLYTEKLMDNNFAVTDEPTAHASVLRGKTALIFTATSRIQNMTYAANNDPGFTLLGLKSMSTAKGVTPLYSYADDAVTFSYWSFIPEKNTRVENSLNLLNYFFTEAGNILANFGEENSTFTYVNNNPVYTEFVTKNPQGLPLDGILRTYGLMNFPIIQDRRMSYQRFPLQQQIQAMEAWVVSDGSKYRIINDSILGQYADEYAALVTDINTFIEESQAQFISGALPLDRFETHYIPTLKAMGMDRLIEIRQLSYDAYNK